jgi:hypothetical protein
MQLEKHTARVLLLSQLRPPTAPRSMVP